MTILASDIQIRAAVRMNDAADGGGPMSTTTVQDGLDNNVFPDVAATDRAFGRLQVRKLYPAVLNTGTDALLGANVIVEAEPTDATVQTFMTAGNSLAEDRADLMALLQQAHWQPLGSAALEWSSTGTRIKVPDNLFPIAAGLVVYCKLASGEFGSPVLLLSATDTTASGNSGFTSALAGSTKVYDVTFDGTWAGTATSGVYTACLGVPSSATPRLYASAVVAAAMSAGDTSADADSLLVQLVPKVLGPNILPGFASALQIDPANVQPAGVAAAFRAGDVAVVHHTLFTTAATVVAGNTINCGRTALSRVVIVDALNKVFTTGYTANLAAGTVAIDSVTGWTQPVRARHTIEDMLGISRTGYPEVRSGASVGGNSITRGPFTLTNGLVMYCGRTNVAAIKVYSRDGQDITGLVFTYTPTFQLMFTPDLAAGTVTLATMDSAYLSGFFNPSYGPVTLVASGTTAVATTPTLPQANPHRITFNRGLARAFPAGARISSALLLGDLQATVSAVWSQDTWTSVWADSVIGAASAGQYNELSYPILVTNKGAVTERWAVVFKSPTTFDLFGETLGLVASGSTNTDLAPTNPATSVPYLTLRALGWSGGWGAGDALRFNTTGANAPVWAMRSTLPSVINTQPDELLLSVRGDYNV